MNLGGFGRRVAVGGMAAALAGVSTPAAAAGAIGALRGSIPISGSRVGGAIGVGYLFALPDVITYAGGYGYKMPWDAVVTEMIVIFGAASTCDVSVIANDVVVAGATVSVVSDSSAGAELYSSVIPKGRTVGLKITGGLALLSVQAIAMLRRAS